MAWFGVLLLVGEAGQSAAVCFYVASDPGERARLRRHLTGDHDGHRRARAGRRPVLAPVLAHGQPGARGRLPDRVQRLGPRLHRHELYVSPAGQNTARWNLVRVSQPALALAGIIVLQRMPPAHPGYRHRHAARDHDAPARLCLSLVPTQRAGPGTRPVAPRRPAREVRADPALGDYARRRSTPTSTSSCSPSSSRWRTSAGTPSPSRSP